MGVVNEGYDAYDLLNDDASNYVEITVDVDVIQWSRVKVVWGLRKLP